MKKTIEEYKKDVISALKKAGTYNRSLDFQILSLASALRQLDLTNDDIDQLTETTVLEETRYGSKLAPHPVFKIQRDAQDSVTRQMKALGLTAEMLVGADDDDPLIELTKKVKNATRKKPNTIKRNAELKE